MSSPRISLASLAPQGAEYVRVKSPMPQPVVAVNNMGSILLWFIIAAAVIWFLLMALKPAMVLKRDASGQVTNEVDQNKALMTALVGALIIAVIVWFSRRCY